MIGFFITISLCFGSAVVLWRAVHVIDRMSRCTCRPVAWSWIGLSVASIWVMCATLTSQHLPQALAAFVVASAAVMATDRRHVTRNRRRLG